MRPGDQLAARYTLLERLGLGDACEVWTARDALLGREVVLKLFPLYRDGRHDEQLRRFEHEGTATALVDHPNVVTIHDRIKSEDVLGLVLERVPGHTLAQRLKGGAPLPEPQALEIAIGLGEALAAAHAAGVVHRDLKPNNVMITPDGRVKLLDFSIATRGRAPRPIQGGTPEYGAPEQFGPGPVDERCDLYALGGVLFTMLTGERPFADLAGAALLERKRAEPARAVGSVHAAVGLELATLVDWLLERDPDRRPESAAVVLARLVGLRLRTLSAEDGTLNAPTRLLVTRLLEPDPQPTWILGRIPRARRLGPRGLGGSHGGGGWGLRVRDAPPERSSPRIALAGLPGGAVGCAALSTLTMIISLFTPWTLVPADDDSPRRRLGFELAYAHADSWIYLLVLSFTALIIAPALPRGLDLLTLFAAGYGLGLGVLAPLDTFIGRIPARVVPPGSLVDGGVGVTYAAGLLGLVSLVGAVGWQLGGWTRRTRAYWVLVLGALALGEKVLSIWISRFEALFTALGTLTTPHQIAVDLSGAAASAALVCCCVLPPWARSRPAARERVKPAASSGG